MEENKLQDLEKQASENAATKDPFMPETKEKKKRGRPPKSATQAQGLGATPDANKEGPKKEKSAFEGTPTHQIIKPALPILSSIGVSYAGHPAAALKPEELEALAYAMGAVVDKYLPDAMNKYGPEIMLGVVLGQYALRVTAIRKLKQMGELDPKPEGDHAKNPSTKSDLDLVQ